MSVEYECDQCEVKGGEKKKLGIPVGWLDSNLRVEGGWRVTHFCSVLCLAEWAIDRIEPSSGNDAETRKERVRRLDRERQRRRRTRLITEKASPEPKVRAAAGRPRHLLTTKQVSQRLNVSRGQVGRMLQRGDLDGVKVGSVWRVQHDSLDKYLGNGH